MAIGARVRIPQRDIVPVPGLWPAVLGGIEGQGPQELAGVAGYDPDVEAGDQGEAPPSAAAPGRRCRWSGTRRPRRWRTVGWHHDRRAGRRARAADRARRRRASPIRVRRPRPWQAFSGQGSLPFPLLQRRSRRSPSPARRAPGFVRLAVAIMRSWRGCLRGSCRPAQPRSPVGRPVSVS